MNRLTEGATGTALGLQQADESDKHTDVDVLHLLACIVIIYQM